MNWKRFFSVLAIVAVMALCGTVYAVHTHSDFTTDNPVYDPGNTAAVYVISNQLNFADLKTFATGGVTTADVVRLLDIPAGTYVLNVGCNIVTATSTSSVTGTATIGDGDDPNGWITAFTIGATASGVSNANGAYYLVTTDGDIGKLYSTADTIDMVIPTLGAFNYLAQDPESILTNFVVQTWAICIKPSTQRAYGTTR